MKQTSLAKFLYLSVAAAIVTILLKFYAYHVTGSMGFLSDALESFVNLFAALFALIMLKVSQKPADDGHVFGHSKAEYFSSATEGALILIAAFSIIRTAIPRIVEPAPIENINTGLLFSLLASMVNLVVGFTLIKNGKKSKSLVLEADGRHLMTDVWTSVGVIVGILLVKFTGWLIIDPIIAILVALNIIYAGYKLISRSASGLMDATIPAEDLEKVILYLDSLKVNEIEYHSLLTRVAGQRKFISMHLLVPGEWSVKEGHDWADKVEETIIGLFNEPVTVSTHIEPVDDPASMEDIGIDRVMPRQNP
ncbi:MAG: cation diffusion facilitator family transporter [Proteiniphilum sp.]|jgi:cation diffusion facilitator family transporter|nr:cation diffusion facilitator family transporter [Proteiniphilum sp.]MDD2937016.1 cation diffusion facilitator family transporter [Proteiniphilum sp.]MDD3075449.1 cation diffusion facilitator family transporter [Proteiniphilum sp.]MDD3778555.1 cation diffusion facilitator family transporter [Proteiniphilum sp.]MDD3955104.1 cation diffusion facilitator family transporter [Proteiniphilum sp.]